MSKNKEPNTDKNIESENSNNQPEAEKQEENATDFEISKKDEEIKSLQDKILRLAAEIENTKKRFQKEVDDAYQFSVAKFAKEMIVVLGHIESGLSFINKDSLDEKSKPFYEGMEMIKSEFISSLEKFGITKISPKSGDKFDYNLHKAVSKVESKEIPIGLIVSLISTGYKINERVLKEAMVTVSG